MWVQKVDGKNKEKISVVGTIVKMDEVISLYINGIGWEGVYWIKLAQNTDRQRDLTNAPSRSTKADEILDYTSDNQLLQKSFFSWPLLSTHGKCKGVIAAPDHTQ